MAVFNRLIVICLIAFGLTLVSCGPPAGDASIEVTTSNPGSSGDGDVDTVVQERTEVITDTVVQERTIVDVDTVVKEVPAPTPGSTLTPQEMTAIDRWLSAHSDSLNQYGDPIDIVYAGGTPLFDERTGKTISKYEYIVQRHPDRPWLREPSSASPRR